jgi:hypothetical protein
VICGPFYLQAFESPASERAWGLLDSPLPLEAFDAPGASWAETYWTLGEMAFGAAESGGSAEVAGRMMLGMI